MDPLRPFADHQFDPFQPHPELDDVDISHLQNADWNDDSDPFGMFSARGLPPPKIPRVGEVRLEATERVGRIFANFHLLKNILSRHEATIQKRWAKKTRTQRLAIFQGAWPAIPENHRPDFLAMRKNPKPPAQLSPKLRSAYIWPYINKEDMGKPKTLPLLLNSRGRHHPSQFAAFDGECMHLGKVTMAITPIFLNGYVMLLNGMSDSKDYGKVIAWEDEEDAFDWMTSRKQFLPGEGLLILEAQDRLLAFLVECCHQILHDIEKDELFDDARYHILPEPQLKDGAQTAVTNDVVTSLAAMAGEAPYRLPEKLDLERIERLLAARKASAEDHAWALREDPGYFAEELWQMREHRQEMIKDSNGNMHPTLRPGASQQGVLWSRVLGNVLVEAYFQLDMFTELHKQAKDLRRLHSRYAATISPLDDLPEPFLAALLKFRHYVKQAMRGPANQIKTTFFASPPMRRLFVRQPPAYATSSQIVTMLKPGVRLDDSVGHLVWLLQTLWEDGNNLFLAGMTNVIDELDRALTDEADSRARDCVSAYTARMIGEISILGECLRQLDIYQPWANGFENALVDRQDGIKKEFAERMKLNTRILEALQDKNLVSLHTHGDPSDNKFAYPVDKRRNQANVEALRAAEANLDAFWHMADELVRTRTGSLQGSAMATLLSQPRYFLRTPVWVEPRVPTDQGKKKGAKSIAGAADQLSGSLVSVSLGPEKAISARSIPEPSSVKAKLKTRGASGAASLGDVSAEPQPLEGALSVDQQPMFSVDARALKVFRIVFFDPAANTTPGEVAWNDFLHALQSTGFRAQKLYGSVWHFQPTTLDVERSIQFHEPHPRGKIPFFVARRHGRRLGRAYGWHGEMFILRKK